MTFTRRLFSYGAIGLLIGFGTQVGYILCYFSEPVGQYLFLPFFYAGFWPTLLLDLLGPDGYTRTTPRALGLACLISLAGWFMLGILIAVGRQGLSALRGRNAKARPGAS